MEGLRPRRLYIGRLYAISGLETQAGSPSRRRCPTFCQRHSSSEFLLCKRMAQVFKFKFQDTLRRWVAPSSSNADLLTFTFADLDSRIRGIFQLSSSALLAITYVDRDGDVVSLADDQDLIDACIVQGLNPLHLDIVLLDNRTKKQANVSPPSCPATPCTFAEGMRMEDHLKKLGILLGGSMQSLARYHHGHPMFGERVLHHTHESPTSYSENADTLLGEVKDVNYWQDFGEDSRNTVNALANHRHGHLKLRNKPPNKREIEQENWMVAPVLHWGVGCDGCGSSPIEGPRYKSIRESDFDLCGSCFDTWGNESDYLKFDLPSNHPPRQRHQPFDTWGRGSDYMKFDRPSYHPPRPPHDPHHHSHHLSLFPKRWSRPYMAPPHRTMFTHRPYGAGLICSLLPRYDSYGSLSFDEQNYFDAWFLKDVTVFDGTKVAPGTRFTKIWRMSNVGSLPWPQSTQLVHIGGDVLGKGKTFILELPESGIISGEEAEISVELVAPDKAGRYVSHWRLSALGQTFGHRVWVVIQVVPSVKHSFKHKESLEDSEKSITATKEPVVQVLNDMNRKIIDVWSREADNVLIDVVADDVQLHLDLQNDGTNARVKNANVDQADIEPLAEGQFLLQTLEVDCHENSSKILYPDRKSECMIAEPDKWNIEDNQYSFVEKPNESMDWPDVSKHVVHECTWKKDGLLTLEIGDHENRSKILYPDGTSDCMIAEPDKRNLDDIQFDDNQFSLVEKPDESIDWPDISKHVVDEWGLKKDGLNDKDLVHSLESMGLSDWNLNISALHNCKLEQESTMDKLLLPADWTRTKKILEEMGFMDKSINERLLVKNQGSLKQTVKDLVKLEKQ